MSCTPTAFPLLYSLLPQRYTDTNHARALCRPGSYAHIFISSFINRLFSAMLRMIPRLKEAEYDCLSGDERQGTPHLEACYGLFCQGEADEGTN